MRFCFFSTSLRIMNLAWMMMMDAIDAQQGGHHCKKTASYKRVKGRSHSVEEQFSTVIKSPCNQQAITALIHTSPHCTSNTATTDTPYSCHIMTSTLAPPNQHHNANPADQKNKRKLGTHLTYSAVNTTPSLVRLFSS